MKFEDVTPIPFQTPEQALAIWSTLNDDERNWALGYIASIAPRAVFEAAEMAREQRF